MCHMKITMVLGCDWAAVLVAAVTLVSLYSPLLGQVQYVLVFTVGPRATWYGGAWAGVVAAVLSCVAIDYFFLPPVHSFFIHDWHDGVRVAVFLAGVAAFNYMIVSDRQAKEKAFWQHQQALRMLADRYLEADKGRKTSEALFRPLVDALPDHAVLPLDDLGHVAVWNQRAAQVTGYPAEQVIGQDFTRLCPGP